MDDVVAANECAPRPHIDVGTVGLNMVGIGKTWFLPFRGGLALSTLKLASPLDGSDQYQSALLPISVEFGIYPPLERPGETPTGCW